MKQRNAMRHLPLTIAVMLIGALALSGCKSDRPDEKAAVINALVSKSLFSVTVTQDRGKGVITLTGDVATNDSKQQAATLAAQAAPGYSIANNIRVIAIGFGATAAATSGFSDTAIQQNFQALIKSDKDLNDQKIDAKVNDGTLILEGTVRTAEEKNEADLLAWRVPNVRTVVNQLAVRSKRHRGETS